MVLRKHSNYMLNAVRLMCLSGDGFYTWQEHRCWWRHEKATRYRWSLRSDLVTADHSCLTWSWKGFRNEDLVWKRASSKVKFRNGHFAIKLRV
jgi:hypothetical protein